MLVDVSTVLPCPIADVVTHVKTPRLLEYVAKPIVRFVPVSPNPFPAVWPEGTHWVKLRLLGFIPFGRQAVVISYPPYPNGFSVRDSGHSHLIARWDHTITHRTCIRRDALSRSRRHRGGSIDADHLGICADLLPPPSAALAQTCATCIRIWRPLTPACTGRAREQCRRRRSTFGDCGQQGGLMLA